MRASYTASDGASLHDSQVWCAKNVTAPKITSAFCAVNRFDEGPVAIRYVISKDESTDKVIVLKKMTYRTFGSLPGL